MVDQDADAAVRRVGVGPAGQADHGALMKLGDLASLDAEGGYVEISHARIGLPVALAPGHRERHAALVFVRPVLP